MLSRLASRRLFSYQLRYLNQQQVESYNDNGFVLVRGAFPQNVIDNLQQWATEMENLPETKGKWMKYYEYTDGKRLLCRMEDFTPYLPHFKEMAYGLIQDIAGDCFGEPAALYKEKLNFKLSHGSGFASHQDHHAFVSFNIPTLLTVLVAVDPNTRASGGLDVIPRLQKQKVLYPTNKDGSLRTDIEAKFNWFPMDCQTGDMLFFDSYVPHRSDVNVSNFTRRNLYFTYNPAKYGFFRDAYYDLKRRSFPPEIEREPGVDYTEGQKVFNVANPIK